MKTASLSIMPGDIRRDPALRQCSLLARGLWSEIWYLAHEGEPYGSLRVAGRVFSLDDMPSQVGRPLREVRKAWDELLERRIPVVFHSFGQLLAEVRMAELYWLRPAQNGGKEAQMRFPQGGEENCGNPAEKLRMPVEKLFGAPSLTPPLTPPLTPQVIGDFAEDSLLGCWFVRRMVRDEEKRRIAKKIGALGGNPKLRRGDD